MATTAKKTTAAPKRSTKQAERAGRRQTEPKSDAPASTSESPRLAETMKTLEQGIRRLTDSAAWVRYLTFQAQFWTYSANNIVLIAGQRPEATRVMGFRQWPQLGRQVMGGEKAIWILAPSLRKHRNTVTGLDEKKVVGFKAVPVFDVSQTEGDPVPEVTKPLVATIEPALSARVVVYALSLLDSVRMGLYTGAHLKDVLVQVAKKLLPVVVDQAHEHRHFEAESVAFIVMRTLGVVGDDYDFGYVATWAADTDPLTVIKASTGRVQRAAKTVLTALTTTPEVEDEEEHA